MATEKRLIDANALLEKYWQRVYDGEIVTLQDVRYAIENAPTVDAVEVVHGRWVDANGIRQSKCGHCGVEFGRAMGDDCNYCPTCGAKMDGE